MLFCFFDQKHIFRKSSGFIMNWIHLLVLCFLQAWYSYVFPPAMYEQAQEMDNHLSFLTFILFPSILFGDGCAKSQWKRRSDHTYRVLLITGRSLYFSCISTISKYYTFLYSQILLFFNQQTKKHETVDLQGSLNQRSPKFDHISPSVKKKIEQSLQIRFCLLACLLIFFFIL